MSKHFQPPQILQEIADSGETGHLQITANTVTWDIYLVKGKLQYAYHSLQSRETLKHYLVSLNYSLVSQIKTLLDNNTPDNYQLISIVNQLVAQNSLSASQGKIIIEKLIQDALESCFWLVEGESMWQSINPLQLLDSTITNEENLLEIPPLLESLQTRLQTWQKFSPWITSPHQRPLCINPSLLEKPIPSGNLSPVILQKLVKLMRGATIRELGVVLKQDDLKVTELLFPYIQNKVLQLLSPKSPLNQLPQIPPLSTDSELNSPKLNLKIPTEQIPPVQSESKIYTIVCIDDSPTILDTIKDYLDSDKYKILTVEEPMKSLYCLFDSKPDLILMDFSMPGINGNRLCQILKSSSVFQNTPIIMVSGNTRMLEEEKIKNTGVSDYLAKPFTRESLLAMVEKHLI